jgi:hypothetical protein
VRHDIRLPGYSDDEQIVAQAEGIRGAGLRWFALPKPRSGEGGRAQDDPGGAAQGGLQYLPACMNVLGHHGFRKV